MSIAQIVQGGVVVNTIAVDPTSVVSPDGSKLTWASGEYNSPPGASLMMQPGAGIGWTVSGNVLVAPAIAPPAPTQAQLTAYANAKQWALATGGHTVTVGGSPHVFATDAVSLSLMDGKVARLGQANPPTSFNWQIGASWLTISAADFITVATSCADFVQATFDALKTVETEIASDAIMTFAQIDAYAWPV